MVRKAVGMNGLGAWSIGDSMDGVRGKREILIEGEKNTQGKGEGPPPIAVCDRLSGMPIPVSVLLTA
jgi:hypothetical protein